MRVVVDASECTESHMSLTCEGGASKDADDLGLQRWQVVKATVDDTCESALYFSTALLPRRVTSISITSDISTAADLLYVTAGMR